MLKLSIRTKASITPLIEVPEIGYDFETGKNDKSLDEHLTKFTLRVFLKWQKYRCFVDIHPRFIDPSARMADGQHPLKFVFDRLRKQGCMATPVTGIDHNMECQDAIKEAVYKDGRGLCLRIRLEDAVKPDIKQSFDMNLAEIGMMVGECDLILDLGAPNFEPVEGFAKLIVAVMRNIPYLPDWRTFTMIGTSFPSSMGEVRESPATIQRSEWLLYKKIIEILNEAKMRLPTFGDYAIHHPDAHHLDMRIIKPSATIRYTANNSWFIVKGPNVRDHGYEQFRGHCGTVITSPHYLKPEFSYGDRYIDDCASGVAKTGNLSTWRMVGTNHHIEKVVSDVSSLFGSSGNP